MLKYVTFDETLYYLLLTVRSLGSALALVQVPGEVLVSDRGSTLDGPGRTLPAAGAHGDLGRVPPGLRGLGHVPDDLVLRDRRGPPQLPHHHQVAGVRAQVPHPRPGTLAPRPAQGRDEHARAGPVGVAGLVDAGDLAVRHLVELAEALALLLGEGPALPLRGAPAGQREEDLLLGRDLPGVVRPER